MPLADLLVARKGRTYFVAVMTHGAANVASASMASAYARSHGFSDVVVATSPIAHWPPMPRADFYVRGTLTGADSAAFPRRKSIPLGSVELLDAWEV